MTRHVDPATLEEAQAERLRLQAVEQFRLTRRSQALLAAAGMSADDVRWYVLVTSVGHEKAVEKALAEAGVPHWLPACEIRSGRRRGCGTGERPVRPVAAFPGYLLVRIVFCAEHCAAINGIDGVRGMIGSNGKPVPVPDGIVMKLQHDLHNDKDLIAKVQRALKAGEQVLVKDGPFAEWIGNLASIDNGRGVVELDIFGRVTPVSVDLAQLTRLG